MCPAVPATQTRHSVPVIAMWDCPRPQAGAPAAGYPLLEEAVHTPVYIANETDGAYNHHSRLTHHAGSFLAMWSNHPHGEDGPGQRVLAATSEDGTAWPPWMELFPAPQAIKPSEEMGLSLTAFRWLVLDGTLYAVAGLHANIGFTDFNRTRPPVPVRDADHPARARHGYSSLARAVATDGALGPIFSTGPHVPEGISFSLSADPTGGALAARLRQPENLPAWDFLGEHGLPKAREDGHRLCEPAVYQDEDGQFVMLLRDCTYSHRLYRSMLEPATHSWSPADPTDIPDSPSLCSAVNLKDGTVLLVGNQVASEQDNEDETKHYCRDPLTVAVSPDGKTFTRCTALRSGRHEWRVPQSKVKGRGPGPQYPSALVHEGCLLVQYSMGKEDIWVSSVGLEALGISA